jgi:uncharacterized protein
MDELLPRGLRPTIERAWASRPVVVLEGLRATGKSTIARSLVPPQHFRTFADETDHKRASSDLKGWLESLPSGAVVDEAQLVPNLQLGIKQIVDTVGASPSQFLLTGSARLNTRELGGSDPLAGRVRRLRLHPFTQSEIEGQPRDTVTALFEEDPRSWSIPRCDHNEVIRRAAAGGFPTMRSLDPSDRAAELDAYVRDLFSGNIYTTRRDVERLVRFFRWLTGRSGSARNVRNFAEATELAQDTVHAYLDELAEVHLVESVRGFRPGQDRRETERERIFVADPSFVAAALPDDPAHMMQNTDAFCRLLETFVVTELIRVLGWSTTSAQLFHWRENDRHEVDLVIERRDGSLVGIEIKAARSATQGHTTGLRRFRDRYGSRFVRGYVLHSADNTTRFDDDIWALPFSALWTIGTPVDASVA